MRAHQALYPVVTMCRVLGVSTSGYYAWLKCPSSERALRDQELTEQIGRIHDRSKQTYGAPRIHAELQEQGEKVARKWVARLMRAAGREGASRRSKRTTTHRDGDARPAPDLVERVFTADGPDQLWVADITYVPPGRVSCISLWSWMFGAAAWWAGPWRLTCGPSWCWTRSTWPSSSAGRPG